jgi:hypothetical protein
MCPASIRDMALAAIARQKHILERDRRGWQFFEEKAASLRLMDEKLRAIPTA